jgi:penicillin-binding protein 1A
MVGVAWIGFDQPKTLGANETGANAALPIWISYMAKAIKGTPEATLPMPEGILAVPINAESGLRDDAGTLTEYFLTEFPPRRRDDSFVPSKSAKDIRDQLF